LWRFVILHERGSDTPSRVVLGFER